MSKYSNKEIQEKSDRLLNNQLSEIFNDSGFELAPHDLNDQRDRGIDWIYEVIDKNNKEVVLHFYVQNKGSMDEGNFKPLLQKNHIGKGKISWTLSIRHIKYYCFELKIPVIFTVCDLENDKIYWHPIQLEKNIKSKIEILKKEEKDVLRFFIDPNKVLSIDNLKSLAEDISNSGKAQIRRLETQENKFINILNGSISNNKPHILLEIESIFKELENFPVLPPHTLPQLYPFALNGDSNSYQSSNILYTDNSVLFSFFENLKLTNGKISLLNPDTELLKINNYESIIDYCIKALLHNFVEHIELIDKRTRLCVHRLYTYSRCNCVSCSFARFNFLVSSQKLLKKINLENEWDELKHIYIHYQFGLFKDAVKLYLKKATEYKKQKKYLAYFIAKYNALKIRNHIKQNYFKDDRNEILSQLSEINLDDEFIKLKTKFNLSETGLEIIKWIKEDKFINQALWEIDRISQKIIDIYDSDQKGGYSGHSLENELVTNLNQLSLFIRGNLICYDNFSEFQHIIHKGFEGLLALYSLNHHLSSKIDNFSYFSIELLLFYGSSLRIKKLIKKYGTNELLYKENHQDEAPLILEMASNFFNSTGFIAQIVNQDAKYPNYHFRDKTNQIFENILIIFSHLKISLNECNKLVLQITNLLEKYPAFLPSQRGNLKYFLEKKLDLIKVDPLIELLNLLVKDEHATTSRLILTVVSSIKEKQPKFSFDFSTYLLENTSLSALFPHLSTSEQDEISNIVKNKLDKNFNSGLYYTCALNHIIDYKKHFNQYIAYTKIVKPRKHLGEIFSGKEDYRITELNKFINLAYYLNLNLEIPEFQKLANGIPYYKWLLNLEEFDYSQFNPYWVLNFRTVHYIDKYKTIPQIKNKLAEFLRKKMITGIADIYILITTE